MHNHVYPAGTQQGGRGGDPGPALSFADELKLGTDGHLLERLGQQKHATPAQIALAWLFAQQPWIVPIPGTRRLERLEENLGSDSVDVTDADLREINDAASKIVVQGARLPEQVLKLTNG